VDHALVPYGELRIAVRSVRCDVLLFEEKKTLFPLLMLGGGLFFFDQIVNQTRHRPTAKTPRGFELRFSLGITHEPFVEGLLGTDVVVIVKGQISTLAAL
jgi:hypothetical protein